jgi:hypothetical protein
MATRTPIPFLVVTLLAILLALPSYGSAQDATPADDSRCVPVEDGDGCLPIAPESARVDLVQPTFSNPTAVTNPLFPIGELTSVLMLGEVDGESFRTEVTLLPGTKSIEWNGQTVEVLVSQYTAYLDGRIQEVALDWYAQADDGAVWYFGEDVFNYEEGVVADIDGTWIAGEDGPPGMIMPGDPRLGDVYRPENIPGLVFEEVTVTTVDVTVDGPHGPVDGAIVVTELHQEGGYEEKTFAPGYGEFHTSSGGDLEAVALAVPTDALDGPPPAELTALTTGAGEIFTAVQTEDWTAIAAATEAIAVAWDTYQTGDVPPMVQEVMDVALTSLAEAVEARDAAETRQAAVDVAQSGFDLHLRYRPPAEIDVARFDLWAKQVLVDAAAEDAAAVTGDVATLGWIRDRFAHTLAPATAGEIDAVLADLRAAADAEDFAAVVDLANRLRDLIAA